MAKDWEKVANGLQQQVKVLRQQNRKLKKQLKVEGIKRAFEAFKASEDCYLAFDSSTKASWGGSGYSVELFPDGHYLVQWDNQFGNLYNSPGLILSIPALGDDEWNDDPDLRFYNNAEDALCSTFNETIEEMLDNAEEAFTHAFDEAMVEDMLVRLTQRLEEATVPLELSKPNIVKNPVTRQRTAWAVDS